ncbi:ribosome hibernation-promoting factor, HPF/YfiA family [Candidatus Endomicrobiellum devescovinae]|jgi:putative sigma-54 modulation protein|uniref:ribosome hibernation-promoting factor, HPF/YfiA family n=1 Tax=Candidatus Endomicrobiellum devescovinae TaxID=3242322 RepID=UPI00283353B0|nr:ribosome-associated translation inhibitor RaiA [Endomicrobium sp.]MDR2818898.1 ribosome-associated translation inhibitor RaiA [Endomicrobium sp.]
MQINITARHLKLTDSIDSYVRKKITKYEKFFNTTDVFVHIILSVEKNRQITEIILHSGKISFRSKEESTNLYASIDFASDKLEKQLRKQKDISKKVHRKDKLAILKDKKRNIEEAFSYDTMEDSRTKISEIKRFDLQPVTVEEAINEMDNLGYKVYMFKDGLNDKVSVLYRNDSGSVILLEPNEM